MTDRANRLRTLIEALRAVSKDGGASTAQELADSIGVSVRTLYRDIDRLRAAGVAIAGKTGVGLRIERNARLPQELATPRRNGSVEAKVRVTPSGVRLLGEDPLLSLEEGQGSTRLVRAKSRESIVRAVLNAGGEVVVVSPEKVRREVRVRARAVARAHKN